MLTLKQNLSRVLLHLSYTNNNTIIVYIIYMHWKRWNYHAIIILF